jgi:hypothetical protein
LEGKRIRNKTENVIVLRIRKYSIEYSISEMNQRENERDELNDIERRIMVRKLHCFHTQIKEFSWEGWWGK